MGIGEPYCDCLTFTLFDLATPWLGDASTQATPCLGDASSWHLYTWATPRVDFDFPVVDFDLVNALIRDGTVLIHFTFVFELTCILVLCRSHAG